MARQALISPRLARLQEQLAAGDAGALAAFWREMEASGAPLIEPIDGDEQFALLTLLWRGDHSFQNVVVVGGPGSPSYGDFANMQMARLSESDLWYRTFRVRSDLRTTYLLSPNDSLVPLDEVRNWDERSATWQPDPLNPRRFLFPRDEEIPGDREFVESIIELPDAPQQPWAERRPGVPAGQVEMHRLESAILGNARRVWVYTPPGYTRQGEPYGLVVLFDGLAYVVVVPTPTTLDNLLAEGLLPPLVAIIVDSLGQETRTRELLCHPPFAEFLAHELIPWARERYHVTTRPERTFVGGSSAGGVAAAFAAFQHPEIFGNVLSQSGWFLWPERENEHGWLIRQYAISQRLPLRFYLDVGMLENQRTRGAGPSPLHSNRHMRDVLQAKGYPVCYTELNSAHDYLVWRGTLADGLLALLGTPGAGAAAQ
jgi:enterochelin esterase family protein